MSYGQGYLFFGSLLVGECDSLQKGQYLSEVVIMMNARKHGF